MHPPDPPAPEEPEEKADPSAADDSAQSDETTELSPEEQMAKYEESLKDTDWGHQPC